MNDFDKLPPHDLDAEEAFIGSLLVDGQLIAHVRDLETKDFYSERCLLLFYAALKLHKKDVAVNQVTLSQQLREDGKLEDAGGAGYLSHLISVTPTSLDYQDFADIVHRLSLYRQLIRSAEQISAIGYDGKMDIADALGDADSLILGLRQSVGGAHVITPYHRLELMIERYTKLYQKEAGVAVETGLVDLDKKLGGGLFDGELTVLAARPSMGKTAMLECISNHVSLDKPVLFCSGEMNVGSLTDRDMAGLTGVSVDEIRAGGYDTDTFTTIVEKLPLLEKYQVYHMEASRGFPLNTGNIYQSAYEMLLREGLGLIVIDYLGLLSDRYGQNSNERLGYITKQLKQAAVALDVPILLTHQLSRAVEMRTDKHPQLSDLRESGQIEEDADNVLFIYRDNYYNPDTANNLTEVLIAKHRQGGEKVGKGVRVYWDMKAQTYRNLARKQESDQGGLL